MTYVQLPYYLLDSCNNTSKLPIMAFDAIIKYAICAYVNAIVSWYRVCNETGIKQRKNLSRIIVQHILHCFH